MYRMRADEENTIMPESGEEREGVVASHLYLGGPSPLIWRHHSAESWLGSAEMIVARMSFRGNALRTVQELHPWQECRKRDYPANTEHNVTLRTGCAQRRCHGGGN